MSTYTFKHLSPTSQVMQILWRFKVESKPSRTKRHIRSSKPSFLDHGFAGIFCVFQMFSASNCWDWPQGACWGRKIQSGTSRCKATSVGMWPHLHWWLSPAQESRIIIQSSVITSSPPGWPWLTTPHPHEPLPWICLCWVVVGCRRRRCWFQWPTWSATFYLAIASCLFLSKY